MIEVSFPNNSSLVTALNHIYFTTAERKVCNYVYLPSI